MIMSIPSSVSVVIPAYNEEGNVGVLLDKTVMVLERQRVNYEIILVDDGSTDKTFSVAEKSASKNGKISILKHPRKRGKSLSLKTGFSHCKGEVIVMMDADLQYDPREIPLLLNVIGKEYDVANGWRDYSKYFSDRATISRIYNCFTKRLLGGNVHDSNCGFKVFRRSVVEDLLKKIKWRRGVHRYLVSICNLLGYRIAEVKVSLNPRVRGGSKYSFYRIIEGASLLFLLFLKIRVFNKKTIPL
jgi:glycosyltransferase involved in cell wall biosynthesis